MYIIAKSRTHYYLSKMMYREECTDRESCFFSCFWALAAMCVHLHLTPAILQHIAEKTCWWDGFNITDSVITIHTRTTKRIWSVRESNYKNLLLLQEFVTPKQTISKLLITTKNCKQEKKRKLNLRFRILSYKRNPSFCIPNDVNDKDTIWTSDFCWDYNLVVAQPKSLGVNNLLKRR